MPTRRARIALTAVISAWLVVVASCDDPLTACTTELRSVIQVDILDSATRSPAGASATIWLRGPFTDSVVVPDAWTSSIAHVWFEDHVKAGTYSLQIQKAGYRDWSQGDIRVRADACHTTTFSHVVALLRP